MAAFVIDVLRVTVSNNEHFFFKKIALISGAVVSNQLPILHLYYSTHGIWLLRFYRPKYPSKHKLMMPYHSLYKSISSKIYRCWIVWGRNISVVIIPTILTLAYLGLSIYLDLLPDFNLLPLGIWLASVGSSFLAEDFIQTAPWGYITTNTSVAISMVVNALVTGLIVWKIFKAFREVQQGFTSAEKSSGIIGGRKYRSAIFIIIESGITLFAIQLVRVILSIPAFSNSIPIIFAENFIIVTHQMLNVTITLVIINLYFADNVDLARA